MKALRSLLSLLALVGAIVAMSKLTLSANPAAQPAAQPNARPDSKPASAPVTAPITRPVTRPRLDTTTRPTDMGPDVVILKELVNMYQPVPFDHRTHARMAEMWDGCVTCHHRSPLPTTMPANSVPVDQRTQEASAKIPACKSCHAVDAKDVEVGMPNLKGALHRQCLNCHREWAHANSCVVCHQPREGAVAAAPAPTVDDIVGRMHPPLPEPDQKVYQTRFEPADGRNVLFRHKEHVAQFGLKCVNCHRRDTCANCHDAKAGVLQHKPMNPGRTWEDSHEPCMNCHREDRCVHCHFKDDKTPPPLFNHAMTGQLFDKDHENLKCGDCHSFLKMKQTPTCGSATCHPKDPTMVLGAKRPGPVVATQPTLPHGPGKAIER